jgi:hypothetical protein
MIEGMQRALDVSFLEHVLVPIGGREFTLAPQSAPHLERVLNAIDAREDADVAPETVAETKQPWGTVIVKNYSKSIPILAMMFGFNPKDKEGKEAVEHLTEFMVPKLAIRIYEEWRKVNEIDDFLLRTGKPLLDPTLVARLKELRMAELTAAISESIAETEAAILAPTVTE